MLKVSFMADMISVTVIMSTDLPRRSSSLQMAAARWFLPVPGLPLKMKLAILPSNSSTYCRAAASAFICPVVSIL